MTGPITFAEYRARSHLLLRGWVFTYRDADRTTGRTWGRWSRGGEARLDVDVERVEVVEQDRDLNRYALGSGYRTPGAWAAAIKRAHGVEDLQGGAVYRVDLVAYRSGGGQA